MSDPTISQEQITAHGLSFAEYDNIVSILGRHPNLLELGIFSVMWSEHCSYKSSKKWLSRLPTTGPQVVCGPGENAGVVDIGDGQVAVFKMESHNHPSFIEPYQGAATGVGGILRDVFTMGARPVALMNALRFGDIHHPKTRHLVDGVVAGIGGYGNCVGVPTIGGETGFNKSYNGNILVNAMCVGIAGADDIHYASAAGIGNPVLYLGARTGRDGIHGATMASAEFSDETEAKRPTVQVGDPFTEKLLIEASLELMASGCVVAIQDMGAAGLTSSSFEMASRGNAGIVMDLDRVPMRETGMTPYEIMLSESQERMLVVLEKGKESEAQAIFDRWGLQCAVVGEVTDSGQMELRWHGEKVADVPIAPVAGASPVYDRPRETPPMRVSVASDNFPVVNTVEALKILIASPDLCSRSWIFEQYDRTVMADTFCASNGDASIVRIHGSHRGLAMTTDCTPRYCEADPRQGGRQAVAEAYRNLCAVGADPLAVTNCLNFGSPENPVIMNQFVECILGMADSCRDMAFPVVSGNVSLYNETDGQAIQPTPAIGAIGLIDNLDHIAGIDTLQEGDVLYLLGESFGWLGASLYFREVLGREEGTAPPVDPKIERHIGQFVRSMIADGRVRTCHDISDGGLAVALAEMAMASDCGVMCDDAPEGTLSHAWFFGEDQARYVMAVSGSAQADFEAHAAQSNVVFRRIGKAGGDHLDFGADGAIGLSDLRALHEATLPHHMESSSA